MTEPSKPSPTHRILLILVLPWMLPILTPYEEHSVRRVCSPMRPPRVPRIMTPRHTTRHCTVYCTSSRSYCTEPIDRPTAPPRPSRRRLLHPNLPSLVRHQRRKHERKENSRCVHDSGAIPDAGGGVGGGGGGGGAGGRGGLAHTLKWCMRRAHANQYPPSCLMRSLS